MSVTVYLIADTGHPDGYVVFDRNHTSNTHKMWLKAGCDIASFDGRPATELGDAARAAASKMVAAPEDYQQFAPENGLGTVGTTTDFLLDIARFCQSHPKTTVRVSR